MHRKCKKGFYQQTDWIKMANFGKLKKVFFTTNQQCSRKKENEVNTPIIKRNAITVWALIADRVI